MPSAANLYKKLLQLHNFSSATYCFNNVNILEWRNRERFLIKDDLSFTPHINCKRTTRKKQNESVLINEAGFDYNGRVLVRRVSSHCSHPYWQCSAFSACASRARLSAVHLFNMLHGHASYCKIQLRLNTRSETDALRVMYGYLALWDRLICVMRQRFHVHVSSFDIPNGCIIEGQRYTLTTPPLNLNNSLFC